MTSDDAQVPQASTRRRGAAESLGSIVLVFESVIVFLAGLVVFGLGALPPYLADWWGIVAGAVLGVLMIAVAGMLRHRWAFWAGWVLQAVLGLGALLVPAILFVFLIFGGLWAYATIKGAQLDARNARRAAEPLPDAPNGD
ncbi:MAG: DUF4233 domain-containing protein [Microbacterium sp.]|uniref:DUF4233 domain-containing protein n=1 Tax=Microbacterium sp. TaxID=51671 RepID=UPI003A8AD88F